MVNAPFGIHQRLYILRDGENLVYKHAYYREGVFITKLTHTKKFYSIKEVKEIVNNKKILDLFESNITSPTEKWCWENITSDLKESLLFSFYLRNIKKYLKMPNVETEDWMKLPKFSEMYQKLLDTIRISNLNDPAIMIEAIMRTTGRHYKNMRFGHIHFTLDLIEERPVYGIHWDASDTDIPKIREMLTHWIYDDMPS